MQNVRWIDIPKFFNPPKEYTVTSYSTPKPEKLLQRIAYLENLVGKMILVTVASFIFSFMAIILQLPGM